MTHAVLPSPESAETRLPDPSRSRSGDLAKAGLSGLRARPLRAGLSALGIAIGIAAMVSVLGISAVSRAGLLAQINRLGTNLLTAAPGQTMFGDNATLPVESVAMTSRIAGVRSASAVGTVPHATARRTDKIDPEETGGIAVSAARLDLLSTLDGSARSGAYLNSATSRYPSVVLGAVAAERLGIDRAGQRVYIAGRWFTVVGVLNSLRLAPEIDRSALIGWDMAAKLGFDGHPTTVYERSTDAAVSSVHDLLAATVDPEHPDQVEVSRPSDALTAQLAAKSAFNALFLGLGAVALLVGGVGVANIMVISVLERRQEIGLRRALGATRRQIRLQFLTESVSLSLLGGVAGVLLGVTTALVYAMHRGWPLVLPAEAIAGGVAAAVVVGAAAGLYPARRAARLTPTQALATS
ncbi:ABC transporter permease [Actinoallomurus bryophytorum]|uniref:Putative ABC transport system permease protein n=1 Tax=Actinoallomurus bryophytorum TaxID=1490222 RepID=A0A543CF74_9ACTN|nr:ABC transporter permease [Actinoallomurus bryophytorum]TQL95744.1 putative ABC transport system permease protein [Actinoallomurus bryophytorum]